VLEHPHHSVYIILALAHATRDTDVVTNTQKSQKSVKNSRLSRGGAAASQETEMDDESRVSAAKAMIARLKQSARAAIISDTERLCLAYIELANWNVEQYKKETRALKIDSGKLITKLKDLSTVAVPTREIPVDRKCAYDNIVHISGFGANYKLAGGVNLPKIITCAASDGTSSRQLVKGRDDLRQDAVMQQVFGMVNQLLLKDPEASKRQLRVRTYKVIPLSQRSGLLEWCEGTMPIGEYLIGAHERYHPADHKALDCRRILQQAHNNESKRTKHQTFMDICRQFQPIFRHFFMENFCEPHNWYERRLAYTRSMATNSIVGYILGLGDRHVANILVDTRTAELIHIDLGVAFEQGRILPTPETVPFRLTRDLVDGMGVAGVEGVFRRCCEVTMTVMHNSWEALLTILQVLLYDPLTNWSISPAKAYAIQQRRDRQLDPDKTNMTMNETRDILDRQASLFGDESEENVNRVAERVLLRLRQKLQGVEDGVQLSIAGQVNRLIQEAKDSKNLCRVFPGWQPYL